MSRRWPLYLGAALVALLLFFESGDTGPARVAVKAAASLMFLAAVLVQARPEGGYFRFLLAGLVLGFCGDVLLALPPAWFKLGLISFLLCHVCYIFAFGGLVRPAAWLSAWLLPVWAATAAVFLWLGPHLGPMLPAVAAYCLVISVMLSGALAVFRRPDLGPAARRLVFFGALCFYISDLFVARNHFVAPGFENRLLGLPLYYGGQFMLAYSVGALAARRRAADDKS